MRFSEQTIYAAFERHEAVYHSSKLGWNIAFHLDCWNRAPKAFEGNGSLDDFKWLYGQLRGPWKAFRNARGECWSAEATFGHLRAKAQEWSSVILPTLTDGQLTAMNELVGGMRGMKPVTSGVSIVAISKFLHFLNPRLFVIVDDEVM